MMVVTHRQRIGNSVDKELYTQLQQLSKESRINISKLLDEAIADLLIKHNKKHSTVK
jgi:metal-responsive CopG/Arc/MetJ family transcriptional regulator